MTAHELHTDNDLFRAIANGDEKAFATLFHQYRNKVYTIAWKITGSEAVAEEIVLDVFLKVWLKRAQLPELEYFTAWLFTITRNRVFKTLKQLAQQATSHAISDQEEWLLPAVASSSERLLEKEYRQILHDAVSRLSPQQQKVYQLIKEHGMKREEAARVLNLSPETVKRHLAEAMHFIRTYCSYHLGTYATLFLIKELL
ncbi:RNA polymerase sigma-70 factor, ECF subfamily [Chitinophaga eiseniae]|uniref:RNA polymerase sigma-70 factor, ECF subfamily n=1 Tax=Chitinophaga eiseniae TaxID=634771 RepID=A0A1T4L2T6_9BACT|nr:RNA polymerase sigma-70 factor [Chitinophaga eiseniae]SJZ48888.1 RNA polymerase sigma-70 factor, ECF subfamily [Chitinophaga eiseniae]